MSFQDEMRTAYQVSHSSAALQGRITPGAHDYNTAQAYLDQLKGQIRRQLRGNPQGCLTAAGRTILNGSTGDHCLVVDGVQQETAFRQTMGVYLTRQGYVFLRDLQELAAQDGIQLTYSLSHQGNRLSLDEAGLSVQQRYDLPHRSRLTETQPKVLIDYAFQVA
jgi:hypothetical protein